MSKKESTNNMFKGFFHIIIDYKKQYYSYRCLHSRRIFELAGDKIYFKRENILSQRLIYIYIIVNSR